MAIKKSTSSKKVTQKNPEEKIKELQEQLYQYQARDLVMDQVRFGTHLLNQIAEIKVELKSVKSLLENLEVEEETEEDDEVMSEEEAEARDDVEEEEE